MSLVLQTLLWSDKSQQLGFKNSSSGRKKKAWGPSGLKEHLPTVSIWQKDGTTAQPQRPPCTLAPCQHHVKEADVYLIWFIYFIYSTQHLIHERIGGEYISISLLLFFFFHKHINICLSWALRCAACPPGSHQAHEETWSGVPSPTGPHGCEGRP